MKVETGLEGQPIGLSGATIGTFDGVHRAHARAIARLREVAGENGWTSVVITFDTHPRCVLDPEHCPALLTPLDEKLDVLAALEVDVTWVIPFTRHLAALEAASFMELLGSRVDIRHLVSGPDFALGHERRGDNSWLRTYGEEHGFALEVMPSLKMDGSELHSSAIRGLLAAGDVRAAERLLGRPFRLCGTVVRGVQVGRQLGYPTANIELPATKLIPADGVYAVAVKRPGGIRSGALSIGSRPTFAGDHKVVEVHILDFDEDIYGAEISVDVIERLRGQITYEGPEQLARQMDLDVEETRRILSR